MPAATEWTATAVGPTSRRWTTVGADASGDSGRPPPTDVSLVRRLAVIQFERAAQGRSTSPRAMAFAALGAAELLAVDPSTARHASSSPTMPLRSPHPMATALAVARAATHLRECGACRGDDRCRCCARRPALRQRGLDLLGWLIEYETADGHLSPTPVAGRGAEDAGPARPAAHRGVHARRCVRTCRRRRRQSALARCSPVPPPGSRAPTTPDSHVGPRHRRRIRRSARRRGEPQPGRGVDAGCDLDLQHAQRFSTVPQ